MMNTYQEWQLENMYSGPEVSRIKRLEEIRREIYTLDISRPARGNDAQAYQALCSERYKSAYRLRMEAFEINSGSMYDADRAEKATEIFEKIEKHFNNLRNN